MFEVLLPEGWDSAPLRELVDQNRRITYGIVQPGDWQEPGKGVPLIRGQDYSSGEVSVENLRYVHKKIASKYTRSTVKEGDILLSIVGYVGLCAIVPKSAEGANITQTTARVSPSPNIHSGYLSHYFRSPAFKEEVKKYTKGSAQPGLNLDDVEKMVVRKPKALGEQITIARILDTLDTQTRKTEALIAKLEKVKEGLLHDLLTRGIDKNGRLRPSPEQAPELYKESPLGLIPREWEAQPLSTAVKKVISGAAIKSGEFSDTGKPVIAKSDVTGSKLIDIENREQFVSLQAASLYSRSMVDEGAVVVSLRDLVPSGPTVGMGSIFYGAGVYILAQGTYGLYLKEDLMTRDFFSEITRRSWFRSQARGITVGSTQVHARSSEYVGIIIPIPALDEQIAINERIRSLDENISAENRVLSEASDLKKGLMDDLLTGRVRVTPLLDNAQATTPA